LLLCEGLPKDSIVGRLECSLKGAFEPTGSLQNGLRLRHRSCNNLVVVGFFCEALMKKIAARAPRFKRGVHVAAAGSPGDGRFDGTGLVPVQVAAAAAESVRSIEAPAAMPARKRRGLIEIELGDGKRVSVDESVDAEALGRVLDVLSRR
jgi:hypothetical protein